MDGEIYKGGITGWQIASTEGPNSTIPDPFINDVAGIIDQMTQKGELYKLIQAIEKIDIHITNNPNAHMDGIKSFAAKILHNLYIKYRELGYITDQEEMYRRMFYDVDIATWDEVRSLNESSKPINVPEFRYITDLHEEDINCHNDLFKFWIDINPSPYTPCISLQYLSIPKLVDIQDTNTIRYTFNNTWCASQGAFVFNLKYIKPEIETPLCLLKGNTIELYYTLHPLFGMRMFIKKNTDTDYTQLFAEMIDIDASNYNFICSYNSLGFYHKSTFLSQRAIIPYLDLSLDINYIDFYYPFIQTIDNKSGIYRFWNYATMVDDPDMMNSILHV